MQASSSRPAPYPRLAFVDIETTGLGHARHRIAEIGVVTVDETGAIDEWTTLLDPGRRVLSDDEFGGEPRFTSESSRIGLPRFADIAHELAERLRDRLFVAHNARFDYAFVQAEMGRAGIEYSSPALCVADGPLDARLMEIAKSATSSRTSSSCRCARRASGNTRRAVASSASARATIWKRSPTRRRTFRGSSFRRS